MCGERSHQDREPPMESGEEAKGGDSRDLIIQLARAGEGDPERLCVGALNVLRK